MRDLDERYPSPHRDATVPNVIRRLDKLEEEPVSPLQVFSSPFIHPRAFLLRPDQPMPSSEQPELAPPPPRRGVEQMLGAIVEAPTLTDRYAVLLLAFIHEVHGRDAVGLEDLLHILVERIRAWYGAAIPWSHRCTEMVPPELGIERYAMPRPIPAWTCLMASMLAYERLTRFHILVYEHSHERRFPTRNSGPRPV